eukprot:TRINITY_DN17165_c0_g1_i2.p1 TRINITY_DN17165_c0_g1~~TRINITY_DN17165_c0_g1_i2.p1  ORF type:complete len:288 (-),score=49.19 TRINITY_DN17165_c0_g1_i2:89-952(-)
MYTSSYSSYGSGLGSSLSSRSALPALPASPPYTSPYSGYPRYRDYSNSKFGDISVYSTPVNYSSSRLTRGSSLQDVSPSLGSSLRRLTRQSSLDKERPSLYQPKRNTPFTPGHYEQSYQDQIRSSRSATRHVKEEKKRRPINCNKVCPGIIIGNGETVCDISYLKSLGVTHVLNTAEQHVMVNPAKYAKHGIQYYGFHVDDLPHCDISRYFHRTTDFIHSAVNGGGLVVVNCYMGLSRSASCVLAYLMTKQDMSLSKALDYIKRSRGVRPNEGFLNQLKVLDRRPRY